MSDLAENQPLRELELLAAAWDRRYPRRSAGGRNALSGFSYQFLVALLETVTAWLECDEAERLAPPVFVEKLSDVVRRQEGRVIVVTQVKRRHAATALASGLEELWTVRKVAREETPQLLSRLRFRLLAAAGDLARAKETVAAWSPAHDHEPDELDEFRRTVDVALLHDPEVELLALLANDLRATDPLEHVHRWLGVLVDAAERDSGFESAAISIWNDLAGLANRTDREIPIYHWTIEDRTPAAKTRGEILTGEQPHVRQLREGFFAERSRTLAPMQTKAGAWLAAQNDARDKALRVPVFWIAGRSGAGKSVALIQLLAHLHADTATPILWLGNRIALLAEAARRASVIGDRSRRAIVSIDDPYRPDSQEGISPEWQEMLGMLEAARESDRPEAVPCLICCGPTEQAERLHADFPDDLDVEIVLLGEPDAAEIEDLRGWYRSRTGSDAPEIEDTNLLLVQLFFEWRTGEPLRSFANRFRKRIQAADRSGELLRLITTLLALNRLYVGYPGPAYHGVVPAPLRDLLERLQREHHIEAGERDDRNGVWLAHPHLANCIYEAWFPASSSVHERRSHVLAGAAICREHGQTPAMQTAPIWSLARGATDRVGDLRVRIAGDLGELLAELYADATEAFAGEMPMSHLPVWVKLQLDKAVGSLSPDPLAIAIARLPTVSTDETGVRLTCHMMLEARDSELAGAAADEARAAVESLLARTMDWREWPYVAIDMFSREPVARLRTLIPRWCEAHINHSLCPRLVHLLAGDPDIDEDTWISISALAAKAPAAPVWNDVVIDLLRHGEGYDAGAMSWVSRNWRSEQAAIVLGHLMHHSPDRQIAAYARDWCEARFLHPAANYVLEPLLELMPRSADVRQWAEAWIGSDQGDAGFLIKSLIRGSSEPTAVAYGAAWLRRQPAEHPSWGYVWEALPGHDSDPELLELARDWLRAVDPNHLSWSYVWEALRHSDAPGSAGSPGDDGDPELLAIALDWLHRVDPGHVSWSYVWEALPGHDSDPELLALARDWLHRVDPTHESWSFVWRRLPDHDSDPELVALAVDWLRGVDPNHESWKFVWEVLPGSLSDPELLALAAGWLRKTGRDHPSWAYVWEVLPGHDSDPELVALAVDWLRGVERSHGSWKYVWEMLPGHDSDPELLALARDWLRTAPFRHPSWSFVWRSLPGHDCDPELLALARDWLRTVEQSHGSWKYVWEALPGHDSDPELVALAVDWLRGVDPNHGSWKYVWEALPGHDSDPELLEFAVGWLRTVDRGHPSWGYLWLALPGHDSDPELLALAVDWLGAVDPSHGSWTFVWRAFDDPARDPALMEAATRWLREAPPGQQAWPYVWLSLPDDARLGLAGEAERRLRDSAGGHRGWRQVAAEIGPASRKVG